MLGSKVIKVYKKEFYSSYIYGTVIFSSPVMTEYSYFMYVGSTALSGKLNFNSFPHFIFYSPLCRGSIKYERMPVFYPFTRRA